MRTFSAAHTLSQSSVRFLERLSKETKAPSVSFILDTLIRQAEEQRKRSAIDQAVSDYYSNLSDEDERELSAWGQFSMQQMRKTKG